jgi:hypothetical protein
MKKQKIKLNEENINSEHWNNKIDMLLRTLQYLKDHLENGLFVVDGFVGGQRMEAINRIGLCCMALNDILDKGGITLTDKSVPVASPYKLNESQLRNIIKESVKKVLNEYTGYDVAIDQRRSNIDYHYNIKELENEVKKEYTNLVKSTLNDFITSNSKIWFNWYGEEWDTKLNKAVHFVTVGVAYVNIANDWDKHTWVDARPKILELESEIKDRFIKKGYDVVNVDILRYLEEKFTEVRIHFSLTKKTGPLFNFYCDEY